MKDLKKLLALVLTLCMVMTLLPVTALANVVDVFHYVLNKLLPPELAEALIDGLADEEEMAGKVIDEVTEKVEELVEEKLCSERFQVCSAASKNSSEAIPSINKTNRNGRNALIPVLSNETG